MGGGVWRDDCCSHFTIFSDVVMLLADWLLIGFLVIKLFLVFARAQTDSRWWSIVVTVRLLIGRWRLCSAHLGLARLIAARATRTA